MKWERSSTFDGVWTTGSPHLFAFVIGVDATWRWRIVRDGLPVIEGLSATCDGSKEAAEQALRDAMFPELTLAQSGEVALNVLREIDRRQMVEVARVLIEIMQLAKRELPRAMREAGLLP